MNESPPVIRKVVALHPKGTEFTQQPALALLSQKIVSHLLQLDMLARHLIFFLVTLPSVIMLGLLFDVLSASFITLPMSVLAISFGSWLLALGSALASLLLIQYPSHEPSLTALTHYFDQHLLKKRYLLIISSLLGFFASVLLIFSVLLSSF